MSTIPQRLDKYELVERLGQGGASEVWKALDTQLQRFVAIKILRPNLREDPHFISLFRREAQLVAALHHHNIVQIHDFQVDQSPAATGSDTFAPLAYMVMDYVEGRTLSVYIHETSSIGRFPPPVYIVNLFASISLAIDYAHSKGMIHRDIKPSNILLDQRNVLRNPMGEPILTDFGMAKLLNSLTNTQSAFQIGTPSYISPEQAKGQAGDARSDLYSLGVILYEMLTGILPFRGDSPIEVIMQHVHKFPIAPRLLNANISLDLERVVMRSLAKNPADRYASATEMTIALAEALQVPIPEVLMHSPSLKERTGAQQEHFPQAFSGELRNTPTFTPTSSPETSLDNAASSSTPSPAFQSMVSPLDAHANPGPAFRSAQLLAGTATKNTPVLPHATPTPTTPPILPRQRWRWGRRNIIGLIVVLMVVFGGIIAGLFYWPAAASSNLMGHAFYVSSGQLNPANAQGIADQVQIDLQNIPNPQPGKSYYAWLLGDTNPLKRDDLTGPPPFTPPVLLTNNLPVKDGNVHYFFPGDVNHNDLLAMTSRLLITEQDASQTPSAPSTDRNTWRYYAALPQAPIPDDKAGFSALIHIRHLFFNEVDISVLGLPGGLDNWLFKNTEKILEWSVSARDNWHAQDTSDGQISLMRDQFVRILDYLDGTPNVHIDLPANTPVLADPTIAKVGLLTVDVRNQGGANNSTNPPGYTDHTQFHVSQVAKATDISVHTRQDAQRIIESLRNVNGWLVQVHRDAKQLFDAGTTPGQLKTDAAKNLLDDMVTQATHAYIGELDPTTNQVHPGVVQAHFAMQQLATFAITNSVPMSLER